MNIITVYNKNVGIYKPLTDEQYEILKNMALPSKTSEYIQIDLSEMSSKKVINYEFNKPKDLLIDKKSDVKTITNVNSSYFYFMYDGNYYLVTEYFCGVIKDHKIIQKIVDYKLYDMEVLKEWKVLKKISNQNVIDVKLECNCGIKSLYKAPIGVVNIDISNSNKLAIEKVLKFIKNLTLTEYKNTVFNCIHFHLLLSNIKSKVNDAIKEYCHKEIENFKIKNVERIDEINLMLKIK